LAEGFALTAARISKVPAESPERDADEETTDDDEALEDMDSAY
jgi:hypothetical protein